MVVGATSFGTTKNYLRAIANVGVARGSLSGIGKKSHPTIRDRTPVVEPFCASTPFILNGMGTKGASSNYYAGMLANHMF